MNRDLNCRGVLIKTLLIEVRADSTSAVQNICDKAVDVLSWSDLRLDSNQIRSSTTEEGLIADIEFGINVLWAPNVAPRAHTRLEADFRLEVADSLVAHRGIQGLVAKCVENAGWVRNASNKRLPSILVEPRIVRPGTVRLEVVEARNGSERQAAREQRPDIRWLVSFGVLRTVRQNRLTDDVMKAYSLIHIIVEKRSGSGERCANVSKICQRNSSDVTHAREGRASSTAWTRYLRAI